MTERGVRALCISYDADQRRKRGCRASMGAARVQNLRWATRGGPLARGAAVRQGVRAAVHENPSHAPSYREVQTSSRRVFDAHVKVLHFPLHRGPHTNHPPINIQDCGLLCPRPRSTTKQYSRRKKSEETRMYLLLMFKATIMRINLFGFRLQPGAPQLSTIQYIESFL